MEITEDFIDYFKNARTVVTLGNFDGIHKGHQKIFAAVVKKAQELNGTPVAITFDPHPVKVLLPEKGLRLITTSHDKESLIFSSGIREVISIDFNADFANTDAEDFVNEIIVGLLKARWVVVGQNYTFGRAKKGNAALLRKLGRKLGFMVSVVQSASLKGDLISSSRVRSALSGGRISEVTRMLGRAYHIEGTVVKGAGRGSSILNTPTANIATENEIVPKEGVYAVRVSWDGAIHEGVANIGRNPTFKDGVMSYEVHIFDFMKNLLGRRLRVHFIERLRDEKKFSHIDDLISQIGKDIGMARHLLRRKKTSLYL
jgi:riboflavin kinase/FMN adenylyltransferase